MKKGYLLLLLILILSGCSVTDNSSKDNMKPMPFDNLTPETKNLFNNLKLISSKGFMFGHQDDVAYGVGWTGGTFNSDVQKVCGDYPAVFGWDIGHIDSTENIDKVPFNDMKRWMIEVFNRGGINTVSWHERNILTGGSAWDTTRVVDKILPGGELNKRFNAQLDKVATLFNSLVNGDGIKIPVVFRPFHEHNGSWFWWGANPCPEEQYKALFRYTVNYLRNEKKANNILFCYSTDAFDSKEEYLKRYPGDKYVDILGFDDYKSIRTDESRSILVKRLQTVHNLANEKGKVAVFSETGYESVSMDDWWTNILLKGIKAANVNIAWVLVWRNANTTHHYAPYPGHASVKSFLEFKKDTSTFFLNDIPNMYN